jgi:hypothetical protein
MTGNPGPIFHSVPFSRTPPPATDRLEEQKK